MHKVAVLVGSTRRESINRKYAEALARMAAGRLEFDFVELGDVPMYDDDLIADLPEPVRRMKAQIRAADAVLFVTPEYNRSFPPVLKNAVDWGTRPFGDNAWAAKPGGLLGTSPGPTGTSAGQNHLKGVLNVVDVVLMGQPEVYLQWTQGLLAADGSIADERVAAQLGRWLDRFVRWIERTSEPKTAAQAGPA